jgi:hypothetical protein
MIDLNEQGQAASSSSSSSSTHGVLAFCWLITDWRKDFIVGRESRHWLAFWRETSTNTQGSNVMSIQET